MELPEVLGVKEFVATVDATLQFGYTQVTVEGEVSGLRQHPRVLYFTLKEGEAVLECLLFRNRLVAPIEDGMKIRATGTPRLHPKYGFRFQAETIELAGEGELLRAFELLRGQLSAEGLFASDRKRILPLFPNSIGLITSPEAAAYHDFLKILGERWQGLQIQLYPVSVQGRLAVGQITAGLDYFNQRPEPVDVVVLIRGGGSLEDLQAFNTEPVARGVAASRTPIVVGVGHEVDVSLAELAADVRAATPTQAAQLVVPDRAELGRRLQVLNRRLSLALERWLDGMLRRVERLLPALEAWLGRPRQRLEELDGRLRRYLLSLELGLQQQRVSLANWERLLTAASPERILARGYSITYKQGRVVHAAAEVSRGDRLVLQLAAGKVAARAEDE